MPTGTVKWFNSTKGYGFIQPQGGGKDVFVHILAVERAGLSNLNEGQVIDFEGSRTRGKTSAENSKGSTLTRPSKQRAPSAEGCAWGSIRRNSFRGEIGPPRLKIKQVIVSHSTAE